MLNPSLQDTQKQKKGRIAALISLIVLETILVTTAIIPGQMWTRLLPGSPDAGSSGPYPASIATVIPFLLYVIPTLVGFLARNWQQALFYATLPAWIGLGLFVTAATSKIGIFYLVANDSVAGNVSVLELFAALGAIGWLAQYLLSTRSRRSSDR
jgi:hypothetical protein